MCPKVTSQHKLEVRGRIIQSAIKCFSKNGFDRTRMDEISLSADLSKGTLYNYQFPALVEMKSYEERQKSQHL